MTKRAQYSVSRFISVVSLIVVTAVLLPFGVYTWSGEYPERTITFVVPYGHGGTDTEARLLAPVLGKILGQSVLVENREGGGGSIGTYYVARSKPDGYTLLYGAATVLSLAPHLTDLPYTPKDLIPIGSTSYIPQIMAVGVNTPWKTVKEFVDYAKKNPEAIKFGSAGTGSAMHVVGEAMAAAAGIKLTHVPFKSSGEVMAAIIGGHVECIFTLPVAIAPQVKGGKLRALAICSANRYSDLPNVPTLTEAGIPLDPRIGTNWLGIFAPKGTPQPICDKLGMTIQKMITDPEIISSLKKINSLPEFINQKDFNVLIEKQSFLFKELVNKIGLKKK